MKINLMSLAQEWQAGPGRPFAFCPADEFTPRGNWFRWRADDTENVQTDEIDESIFLFLMAKPELHDLITPARIADIRKLAQFLPVLDEDETAVAA